MKEQIMGNFSYFSKAQNAYSKEDYVQASEYLDKYLISRNQKYISFKDDPLMGSRFYSLKGKIDEALEDYPMAIESYGNSICWIKKIEEYYQKPNREYPGYEIAHQTLSASVAGLARIRSKILTPENTSLFNENIKNALFETYYDDANDENVLRITIPIAREILMLSNFEKNLFEKFGTPGHLQSTPCSKDGNFQVPTIYDYDISQLKQAEDSNKSFEELVEIFKSRFSKFIK